MANLAFVAIVLVEIYVFIQTVRPILIISCLLLLVIYDFKIIEGYLTGLQDLFNLFTN